MKVAMSTCCHLCFAGTGHHACHRGKPVRVEISYNGSERTLPSVFRRHWPSCVPQRQDLCRTRAKRQVWLFWIVYLSKETKQCRALMFSCSCCCSWYTWLRRACKCKRYSSPEEWTAMQDWFRYRTFGTVTALLVCCRQIARKGYYL